MIHIAQAIVVEGKYDKIKLSSILDAVILVTNGFRIFRDPEKMALIQYYARTTGVIVLTDSDRAGFQIRNYLKGAVRDGKLYHVYIPDIYGKEHRKRKKSIAIKQFKYRANKAVVKACIKKRFENPIVSK